MSRAVVERRAPNAANRGIVRAARLLDALQIAVELETFEIIAHNDVDHTRNRVCTIEC